MLLELHVKNLALIEKADVEFGEGLNILTGETEEIRNAVPDCWRKRIEGRKQNEEKNCICNRK
jgi:hypothetical protein